MPAKILIIDDEKNIRLTLSACLEGTDYEVETAISGEHGLEKFGAGRFDLVLLDMKLPGMDGMEVLRRLKARDPSVKVIMMTAYATIETAVEAMKLGAVDYLKKPFTPEEIRLLVGQVLEREQLSEEEARNFASALSYAKACITRQELDKAAEYLHKAVSLDPTQPEPFNLLGVYMELKGNISEAQRLYRAALALDPSYEPADSNLKRTATVPYVRSDLKLERKADEQGH
ncbi:MAG TPA: response regulator [Firmicutes bacterium]|nr:response regulator [Bacillota bacterium]